MPASGCGQVIGADDHGRAVALSLFGPQIRRVEIAGTRGRRCLDFNTGTFREGESERRFVIDRNEMFLGLSRDFLALVQGRAPSDVEFLPRLDWVRNSCEEIAEAHARRRFTGHLDGDTP